MAVLEGVRPAEEKAEADGRAWSSYSPVAALAVYAAAVAVVIARHEPWFDEAQAWLIARDSSLLELFPRLAYEGQPGLWHLMLMLPAKLLPYPAIGWISGILGVLGVWVLVRWSPFPEWAKVVIPFTYFVFYQYAVVARSYALLPVLMFAVASRYPRRHESPWLFAGLLFLLAASTTSGFLVAGSLLAIAGSEGLKASLAARRLPARGEIVAFGATGLAMAAMGFALLPPADRTFAEDGFQLVGPGEVFRVTFTMLNESLAGWWVVLLPALAASLAFFHTRRVLHLYAVPTTVNLLFFAFVHRAPWHQGVLFLIWVFAFWVALSRPEGEGAGETRAVRIRRAALAMLAVVCLVQVSWSVRTALSDVNGSYSGSRELANYLKENKLEDSKIYAIHWASFALNPYFERNLFDNYRRPDDISYWDWSEANTMVENPDLIEGFRPDLVVFPVKIPGTEADMAEALPNYRQKAVFWGEMFWKGGVLQPEVYLLFERVPDVP
jgi:hypothetical protein